MLLPTTMKFISFEHLIVVIMTGVIVFVQFKTGQEVRLIDAIMLYGIILANMRAIDLERK